MKNYKACIWSICAIVAGIVLIARLGIPSPGTVKAWIGSSQEKVQGQSPAPASAPDFDLKDLSGRSIKLADFKGRVLILNFWATWCGPCRVEIPWLVKLREQYGRQGLEILGISMDDDAREAVADFVKRAGVSYPVVMGNDKTADAYGPIDGLPMTFIVDRQGLVQARHLGIIRYDEIESQVKRLL